MGEISAEQNELDVMNFVFDERDKYKRQRDKLLEAAKSASQSIYDGNLTDLDHAILALRAAIKECEKE